MVIVNVETWLAVFRAAGGRAVLHSTTWIKKDSMRRVIIAAVILLTAGSLKAQLNLVSGDQSITVSGGASAPGFTSSYDFSMESSGASADFNANVNGGIDQNSPIASPPPAPLGLLHASSSASQKSSANSSQILCYASLSEVTLGLTPKQASASSFFQQSFTVASDLTIDLAVGRRILGTAGINNFSYSLTSDSAGPVELDAMGSSLVNGFLTDSFSALLSSGNIYTLTVTGNVANNPANALGDVITEQFQAELTPDDGPTAQRIAPLDVPASVPETADTLVLLLMGALGLFAYRHAARGLR